MKMKKTTNDILGFFGFDVGDTLVGRWNTYKVVTFFDTDYVQLYDVHYKVHAPLSAVLNDEYLIIRKEPSEDEKPREHITSGGAEVPQQAEDLALPDTNGEPVGLS